METVKTKAVRINFKGYFNLMMGMLENGSPKEREMARKGLKEIASILDSGKFPKL